MKTLLTVITLFILSAGASAQTYVGGGIQGGENVVRLKGQSQIDSATYYDGTRIDSYNFVGGWSEAQYGYKFGPSLTFRARSLAEITTDPKNLGQSGRDGRRTHFRPEVEASIGLYGKWSILANGGAGYTRIVNTDYAKSGLNPHVGGGVEYDNLYRFTAARIFKDSTNLNDNATQGWRFRGDAIYPFAPKWGAKFGLEYTLFNNQIPGVLDGLNPAGCGCVKTRGYALAFRVGLVRIIAKDR